MAYLHVACMGQFADSTEPKCLSLGVAAVDARLTANGRVLAFWVRVDVCACVPNSAPRIEFSTAVSWQQVVRFAVCLCEEAVTHDDTNLVLDQRHQCCSDESTQNNRLQLKRHPLFSLWMFI